MDPQYWIQQASLRMNVWRIIQNLVLAGISATNANVIARVYE